MRVEFWRTPRFCFELETAPSLYPDRTVQRREDRCASKRNVPFPSYTGKTKSGGPVMRTNARAPAARIELRMRQGFEPIARTAYT